jgi:uncharacterized protein YdcH (DUF465 family)
VRAVESLPIVEQLPVRIADAERKELKRRRIFLKDVLYARIREAAASPP